MKTPHSLASQPPTRSIEYWETLFTAEDPWQYGTSAYERWKAGLTLGLLPTGKLRSALEVGCAEGHMTAQVAQRVDRLLAVDISSKALERARSRCASFDHIEFQQLDVVEGRLPGQLDLILVSEVLFYLSRAEVEKVAKRFAEHLKVGGHVLLVHGNAIQDDRTRTGFDWGHEFGALTIGRIFGAAKGLALIKELRTPLFSIQLFRRVGSTPRSLPVPQRVEEPLPFDLELLPELERTILWDGAVMTREEAQRTESTTSVPILMYHAIADTGPPELAPYRTTVAGFREQLRYLRSHGYHSISLHEWVEHIATKRPVPGRPVIITFDDGYKDFFESALPALERSDFTATVFVVTDKAGAVADWDRLTHPPRLMEWDEIRAAAARNITIGSHSASHQHFLRITREEVLREGARARQTLHEQLGREVDLIAFPWGASDPEGRRVLAECGYRIGVRSDGGRSTLSDDPLDLSRIEIHGTDDLDTFIRKVTGVYAPPEEKIEEPAAAETETSEPVPFRSPESEVEPYRSPESEIEPFRSVGPGIESPTLSSSMPSARTIAAAAADVVGFAPAAPVVPRSRDFPLHADHRQQLASRLDALVGDFVKLQVQLLNEAAAPMTAQKRLASLFALPVTGRVMRTIQPNQAIIEGVTITFEDTANLSLLVEPKLDHSLSPESHLNTLRFDFSGQTEWLSLNVTLDWREISLAERFQLSLYANSNRSLTCEAALRLPRVGNHAHTYPFSTFALSSQARNAVTSGRLSLPDFIELDTTQAPELAFTFDTREDFSLEINYLNCYFA